MATQEKQLRDTNCNLAIKDSMALKQIQSPVAMNE